MEIQKECKTQTDLFLSKDKILEKLFRKDFLEAPLIVQEQALKLYKYVFMLIQHPNLLSILNLKFQKYCSYPWRFDNNLNSWELHCHPTKQAILGKLLLH